MYIMETIEQKNERFQYWLFKMDDILESFISKFEKENLILDYSIESLNLLEGLILKSFNDIEEIKKEKHSYFYDELVRYVGETFRKNLGGVWKLDIKDENSAYYNLPILDYATPICPHKLVTACIARKNGTFLSTILTNSLN